MLGMPALMLDAATTPASNLVVIASSVTTMIGSIAVAHLKARKGERTRSRVDTAIVAAVVTPLLDAHERQDVVRFTELRESIGAARDESRESVNSLRNEWLEKENGRLQTELEAERQRQLHQPYDRRAQAT